MIKIQKKDFIVDSEINLIKSKFSNIGALSIFVGYVRNLNNNKKVTSIFLEVYKEMAYKYLNEIAIKAKHKWKIIDFLILHRFGKLKVNEKIVLVATFSKNRKDSNESCKFIMDYLKKDAPFWKKEYYNDQQCKWLKNIKKKN